MVFLILFIFSWSMLISITETEKGVDVDELLDTLFFFFFLGPTKTIINYDNYTKSFQPAIELLKVVLEIAPCCL